MIIFVSGSINSGKTTIAKLLKTKIPKTAHIEIDDLRSMVDWMPLEQSIPINLENAASIINNFSDRKINCVVTYPLSSDDYFFAVSKLNDKNDIYFFTLNPSLEIALSNRGERILTDWECERIKHHFETNINHPDFGIVIDNSEQTPEETAKEILSHLNLKN